MKNLNQIIRKLKANSFKVSFAILVFTSTLLLAQDATAQQVRNNAVSFGTELGKDYTGYELQYQRKVFNRFSVVGTFGKDVWKKDDFQVITNIDTRNKKFTALSTTIGLGGEFTFREKPGGFFVQGNLLIRKNKWFSSAEGKVEETRAPSSPSYSGLGNSLGGVILGLLFLGGSDRGGDDGYRYIHKDYSFTAIGFSGKAGYKFMNKKETAFLSPYIGLRSNPKSVFNRNFVHNDQAIEYNPTSEISKVGINFGAQVGVRF